MTDGPLQNASPLTSPLFLAARLSPQGSYGEAERLFKRSLAIREKILGPDHPNIASSLHNLARLLESQVRVDPLEVPDVPDR